MGIGPDFLIKPEIVGKHGRTEQFAAEVRKRIERLLAANCLSAWAAAWGHLISW